MRILHTMLRVGDLDKSLHFYTEIMGMKLLRKKEYPQQEFTLAFVGYSDESETAVLELTYNWGIESYDLGTAYGHVAIGVDDVYKTCDKIKERGGNVVREAAPMQGGDSILAFVEDPDGYKVEILENK